ncbi:hypothetical protein AA106555_0813 [Neokomagataea thailandica NBRC 106555]|uniref:Uncharacterized protein n=1 Tax=Neokomagataea thailandica NBRC 106555 TaxID=1223520 RepID=A0ABQ0QP68_9PROT|nr:hypothetical protein AA106555_0813 [Neokomagataea thailandica NBRC 106555]
MVPNNGAYEAAAPKMSTGVAKGKTSKGSKTPPRLAPSTMQAAIPPTRDRQSVPNVRLMSKIGISCSVTPSISPNGKLATISGSPVVSQ